MKVQDFGWFQAHLEQYDEDPVAAHDWDPTPVGGTRTVPTLLLTTTGAKSGAPRSLPLLYQPCGEGFVLVASKGGAPQHPAWFVNLLAEPKCRVRAGSLSCDCTARVLEGAERARWWAAMEFFWPGYADYQARTDREIPVVILTIDRVEVQQ